MTETVNLICEKCKHFKPVQGGCTAFPGGIPDSILFSNSHSKPTKGQKNQIVFEPGNPTKIVLK
jgi:hypothetical protein